jgi:hypothetical protein
MKTKQKTNWPVAPAPDDRREWNIWLNENWEEKPMYSDETCPSASFSIKNPT